MAGGHRQLWHGDAKAWSRYLVYGLAAGFVAKLGLSVYQGIATGFFDFQFGSAGAALASLVPSILMVLLSGLCCYLVYRHFRRPATSGNAGVTGTAEHSLRLAPALAERRFSNEYLWIVGTLVAIYCGQWLQSNVYLNHDVAWIGHSARWLLNGARFGSDVFDYNPPMVWLLSLPAAALANAAVFSEPTALRFVFWTYFLIASALTGYTLAMLPRIDSPANVSWRTAFIAMATLAPAASFGQREYLCIVFSMPYLALAVVRLHGSPKVGRLAPIAIGALAGVGFAIKPFFLAVPLLIEGMLVLRLGVRTPFRTESLAMAAAIAGYVAAVPIIMSDYVSIALPLARSTYWAYDSSSLLFVLSRFEPAAKILAFGLLIAAVSRSWSRHQTILLLACLGFATSYFVQAKGFVYHAYPVLLCAFVFLFCSAAVGAQAFWMRLQYRGISLRLVALLGVTVLTLPSLKTTHDDVMRWYATYNMTWGKAGLYRTAVIDTVNRYAPMKGTYFYALSTHPFPGFPTGSHTVAEWSGRACCQSAAPAAARIDEISDPDMRQRVQTAAITQREMVVGDMKKSPPSLVFVEAARSRLGLNGRLFDDIAFYSQDAEFASIWREYREVSPVGSLRVFVRKQ